jgi:hypothetical protein
MKREGMRLSSQHRRWFYTASALLFGSGAAWLLFRYGLQRAGEFGDLPHPGESWSMRVHGGAAMLFLVMLGTLIRSHILHGWRLGRNRFTGIAMIATMVLLTLTGYALYYAGGERTRPVISVIHWAIGIGLPAALLWHIVVGRRSSK